MTVMLPMRRRLYAHPGEMGAAERFAVQQQLRVLQTLAPDVQSRISVVVTVCTDFDTFTYNQPAIVRMPGMGLPPTAWTPSLQAHIPACGFSLSNEDARHVHFGGAVCYCSAFVYVEGASHYLCG